MPSLGSGARAMPSPRPTNRRAASVMLTSNATFSLGNNGNGQGGNGQNGNGRNGNDGNGQIGNGLNGGLGRRK